MKLKGQNALITGASRDMGDARARAVAAEGANVAITGRSTHELEVLQTEFIRLGVRCEVIVADLTQRDAVDQVWRKAIQAFGNIDILVNNAGMGSSANPKPVLDYDDDF
ncbi:MAG: SDR family NAD(P)-dependent oxidoreductase, partial [Flavisolibacter sp.]